MQNVPPLRHQCVLEPHARIELLVTNGHLELGLGLGLGLGFGFGFGLGLGFGFGFGLGLGLPLVAANSRVPMGRVPIG